MKFSIIIPAYNAQKYIDSCLKSILEQEYNDFEAIVVNDGSADNTAELVQKYADTDNRIKLINKQNGGVSSARNLGLDNAQGEYVVFVDVDDWIPADALKIFIDNIDKYDTDLVMAKMWHRDVTTGALREHGLKEPLLSCVNDGDIKSNFNKILVGYALKKGVAYSTLAKAYKTSILNENSIRFNENLSYCEDVLFNVDYLKVISSISVVDRYCYCAEDNDGSLTKKFNSQIIDATILSFEKLSELFKEKQIEQQYCDELEIQLLNSLWDIVFRVMSAKYCNVNKKDYRKIVYTILEKLILIKFSAKYRKNKRVLNSSLTAKIAKKSFGKGRKRFCFFCLKCFIGARKTLRKK